MLRWVPKVAVTLSNSLINSARLRRAVIARPVAPWRYKRKINAGEPIWGRRLDRAVGFSTLRCFRKSGTVPP